MRIKPFRAVHPNLDFITSPDEFFGTVKEQYPEYRHNNFFDKTAQEAVYIYQIEGKSRHYTGLVTCIDIHDYLDGDIKKHENTLAAKEQQQMNLMIQRGAIVKPILLTYPDVNVITSFINEEISNKPVFYSVFFEKEQQKHTFWKINDGEKIALLQTYFQQYVPKSYIADGHHRSSTTALMYQRLDDQMGNMDHSKMLCALFPASELDVHDYNRVVEALTDISPTNFMAKLSLYFDIEVLAKERKPFQKHEIVMYLNCEWFALRWKQAVLETHKDDTVILDATLLNEKILNEILGITDVRTDMRVRYVEGPKGIDMIRQKVNKSENRIGFILYPVALDDLLCIADAEQVMPPKSTWFEPRIKNGLIVQEF